MIGAPLLPEAPTTVLRGAGVDVDVRRAGRVAVVLAIAALVATSLALFWAGARSNARVTSLRHDGVPVTVTVSGCRALMGGSGSNVVGYSCTGSFALAGRTYVETLPGGSLMAPGATVREITPASHPGLLADPSSVATARVSWNVFALPAVLLAAGLALAGTALARNRSRSRHNYDLDLDRNHDHYRRRHRDGVTGGSNS